MAHIQKRTRKKVTTYIVRWVEPDGTERSESFAKRGRYDIPGTAEHFKHLIETQFSHGTYVDPDLAQTPLCVEVEKWMQRAQTETTEYQRRNFAGNLGRLAAMPIGAIRRSDVRDWIDQLTRGRPWRDGRPLGAHSVALHYQFLRTVFNIAIEDGVLHTNPCHKITLPRPPDIEKAHADLLTVAQVRSLLANADPQIATMMLLTAQAGLRPSEVAGLRNCDLDLPRRRVHVNQQASHFRRRPPTARLKSRTSKRTVPLPRDVHEALEAFLERNFRQRRDLLFRTKAGNIWTADAMGDRFRVIGARANIPDHFTWHDLRHFYASALIEQGASVRTVQARLGHADPQTTLRIYTHLWPDNDESTLRAIDSLFGEEEDGESEE